MMELTKLLQAWHIATNAHCEITGLHNDSRQIQPGNLFIAYPGALADGRRYIQQAMQAGAVAILYDPIDLPQDCMLPTDIPCIPFPQLATKLAAIASHYYQHPTRTLNITGVTGTNGKTTIAYQLAQAHGLLGQQAVYVGTLGHGQVQALQPLMNTTPDALCLQTMLHTYQQQDIQQVCMEVSSHALSMGRVDCIDFSQAIYTNLSHEHLDFHQTLQAYAQAKASLFAWPSLKWAIINQDDQYSKLMGIKLPEKCHKLTYGLQKSCDVHTSNVNIQMTGSEFEIASPWGKQHVHVKALGMFNVYNSLAVYASLLAHGYPPNQIASVMAKLQASPGRMEMVLKEPCVLVDYAHTPDALENVLTTLVQLKNDSQNTGQIWVVFGCGGDRDKTKRPMMGKIASQYADQIILTSDNPRTEEPIKIIDDIAAGLLTKTNVISIVDREQAIHYALQHASYKDIILIAGKGHEAYQQIGHQRFAFSDQEVVRHYST
jgi:UDP-N-acetylmuramoyl-L-alanyl-D-glutamate--2,6-diaminopimelate ligase